MKLGKRFPFLPMFVDVTRIFCYYVLFFFRAQTFIDRERHACWMYAAKRCPGTYSPAAIIAWRKASAAPKSSRRSASFVALARARAGSPVGFEASETSAGTNSHSSLVRPKRLILVRQYFYSTRLGLCGIKTKICERRTILKRFSSSARSSR